MLQSTLSPAMASRCWWLESGQPPGQAAIPRRAPPASPSTPLRKPALLQQLTSVLTPHDLQHGVPSHPPHTPPDATCLPSLSEQLTSILVSTTWSTPSPGTVLQPCPSRDATPTDRCVMLCWASARPVQAATVTRGLNRCSRPQARQCRRQPSMVTRPRRCTTQLLSRDLMLRLASLPLDLQRQQLQCEGCRA